MNTERVREEGTVEARRITRQDFLKIGSAGLAGAALLGVAGCGQKPSQGGGGQGKPVKGGILQATFQEDPSSLDPAIAYDTQSWPLVHAVFVTLITYNKSGAGFVPWAAKSVPTGENGGKRYVFDIHDGIKFTNGEPVDANAFKYAIQRVLDPETKSPLAGFYTNIVGAAAFQKNPSGDLAGIKVLSPTRIQFDLENPDQTFLQTMAIPSGSAVPKKAVENLGPEFGNKPVTSGPFKLEQWQRGSKLVMVKNKDYFDQDTVAKLDQINFTIGIDPHTGLLRIQQGSSDYMFDQIAASDYPAVKDSPQWKDYVHAGPTNSTWYFYMNTTQEPWTNPKVREALQYAIDKKRIIQVIAGLGVPANQILPPKMPGYDQSIKDTPFDPAKAKQLIEEAGANGTSIEFWDANIEDRTRIDQVIQQNLKDVGIKAEIRSVSFNTYLDKTAEGTTNSGFAGWAQDFPDPSDFLDVLFNSDQIPANNLAKYSNPEIDKKLNEALYTSDKDKRLQMYKEIQKQILADHPWVPLYFDLEAYFVSPKVGGFRIDPVWLGAVYADWYLTK